MRRGLDLDPDFSGPDSSMSFLCSSFRVCEPASGLALPGTPPHPKIQNSGLSWLKLFFISSTSTTTPSGPWLFAEMTKGRW